MQRCASWTGMSTCKYPSTRYHCSFSQLVCEFHDEKGLRHAGTYYYFDTVQGHTIVKLDYPLFFKTVVGGVFLKSSKRITKMTLYLQICYATGLFSILAFLGLSCRFPFLSHSLASLLLKRRPFRDYVLLSVDFLPEKQLRVCTGGLGPVRSRRRQAALGILQNRGQRRCV